MDYYQPAGPSSDDHVTYQPLAPFTARSSSTSYTGFRLDRWPAPERGSDQHGFAGTLSLGVPLDEVDSVSAGGGREDATGALGSLADQLREQGQAWPTESGDEAPFGL